MEFEWDEAKSALSACGAPNEESAVPIVRVSSKDIDIERVLADLAAARVRTEEEIEAEVAEDGGALTDEEIAEGVLVYGRVEPDQIRAVRERMGLSQSQFATKFGLGIDALQQYEQGRLVPSGAASTLLRVISAEPEAVMRALATGRQAAGEAADALTSIRQ